MPKSKKGKLKELGNKRSTGYVVAGSLTLQKMQKEIQLNGGKLPVTGQTDLDFAIDSALKNDREKTG